MFVLGGAEFLFVLLAFNRFELRAHIVVIDLEFEHLLIANRIGNHISMQLAAKYAGGGFCAQRVLRKNGRAGKTKLVELFEFLFQVLLRLAKLAAVAFVKNKHHLLAVNGQIGFAFDEMVKLLNSGDNDFVVVLVQIAFQPRRAV